MPSDFVKRFGAENSLTSGEMDILAAVDVRSYEDVSSLIASFPSIANAGLRLSRVSNAAARHISAAYATSAGNIANAPPSAPLGAEAPAGVAHGINSVAGLPLQTAQAPAFVPSTSIDLRLPGWGIREQAPRGACVAFGATACFEHARASIDGVLSDYSEQFLYWAIKTRTSDPRPTQDGTRLEFAEEALRTVGICHEHLWP